MQVEQERKRLLNKKRMLMNVHEIHLKLFEELSNKLQRTKQLAYPSTNPPLKNSSSYVAARQRNREHTGLFREYSDMQLERDPLHKSIDSNLRNSKHTQQLRTLSKGQSSLPQSQKATISTLSYKVNEGHKASVSPFGRRKKSTI